MGELNGAARHDVRAAATLGNRAASFGLALPLALAAPFAMAAADPGTAAPADSAILAQAGPAQNAGATGPASAGTAGSQQLQEVVVTGSHIATSTFNAPTPVTTIDSNTIQSLGLVSVNDVINQIPQNSNFTSAANVGLGNFNIGAQFANLRGLDPFFGTRTLTLVNTERFVPTSAGGAVDLNVVPSLLISRVDVVTGGASAAYGSDAIAGVVNIILDNNFQGLKLQLDGGKTTHGDGADLHAALAYGKALFDGRFHEVFGAEYEDAQDIGVCDQVRTWCRAAYAQFNNGGGSPHYVIGPGGTSLYPYAGDLSAFLGPPAAPGAPPSFPGPYLGMFNSSGTALVPFNPGNYTGGLFAATQGGDGPNFYDNITIRPPVIHWSIYNHASLDITDSLRATLDISFAQRRATNTQGSIGPSGFPANFIYADNAYLPPSVAAQLFPFPGAWVSANTSNQVNQVNSTTNNVGRVVLGLNGNLFGSWKWDGYYEWGETGTRERLGGNVVEYLGLSPAFTGIPNPPGAYDFLNWALNAVVNPANGQIQCAATIPGSPFYNPLAAGCVPLDLFGPNKANPAALAYAYRTLHQDSAFTQQVISASANGDLFSGWGAGPIKAAIGAEYRHSMADVTHDLADQPWYPQYVLTYGQDYTGTIDVLEGFAEVNIPVLRDLPLARNLSVDLALRETQNKNDETATKVSSTYDFPTWKFSVDYDPVDWLRIRADRSRDTRAPSFYELWAQTIQTGGLFGSVANPWKNPPGTPLYGVPTDPARVTNGSYSPGLGLRPEEADTTTAGVVLTPSGALDGLRASADWFQIIISDAIAEIGSTIGGGGTIVNACYAGATFFCQFVQGTPNGSGGYSEITGVENYNLNLGNITTRGWDFELEYRLPFDRFASGRTDSLDFRVLSTYQYDLTVNAGSGLPPVEFAGVSGPTAAFGNFNTAPKWQGNAFVTYANGPFTGVIQVRYIGEGRYGAIDGTTGLPLCGPSDPGYGTAKCVSINTNSVASATYVNLSLNYTLPFFNSDGHSLQLFGTIDNLLDKDPPVAPGGNGYPTNPVYFDTFGRTWRAGVRVQL